MNQPEATYIYHFETHDGLAVRVRRMTSDDTPHLVDIFEHMSADSRYHRFHQPTEHLERQFVWHEAQHIADLHNAGGLLAFADFPNHPDTVIGGARYVMTGEGRAETAVSIRDDMQRKGIGTRLLQFITEEARLAGVTTLVATIQNDNRAIWRTLKHLPHPLKRMQDGVTSEIEIDLTTYISPTDNNTPQGIQFVGSPPNAI
jgi:GNAT superfamily N-acetyltransferase